MSAIARLRNVMAHLGFVRPGPPLASAQLDLDVVADDLDRIDLDVVVDRRSKGLSRPHVEAPGMERAFDAVAVEPAIRQQRGGVRADVVGGADLAIEVVERDRYVTDLDTADIARGEVRQFGDSRPFRSVRHESPNTRSPRRGTAVCGVSKTSPNDRTADTLDAGARLSRYCHPFQGEPW